MNDLPRRLTPDEIDIFNKMSNELKCEELRRGWRKWCVRQSLETCSNQTERDGWQAAVNANDRGGQRPTASDSQSMTVEDFAAEVGSSGVEEFLTLAASVAELRTVVSPFEVGETGLCWVVYEHGWTALVTVTRRTKNDFTVTGVNAPIVSFGPRVPYWRPDQIVEPTEPVEVDARILALKKQVADLTAHVNRLTKLLGQARAESTAPVVYKPADVETPEPFDVDARILALKLHGQRT